MILLVVNSDKVDRALDKKVNSDEVDKVLNMK